MISPSVQIPEPRAFLDIHRLMDLLPHRYPFLLVDRVTALEPDKFVEACKNVSINEAFFQGHFPGLPVMPGVLIVEAMAQAGGFFVLTGQSDEVVRNSIFLFTGMENVRFRRPVVPGDRLDLHCELIRKKMQLWKMRGTARVDGVLAAEAELTAAIVPKESFS